MDEGDRPTDPGESAGRDGEEETESQEPSDGGPEGPSERSTDESRERSAGEDRRRSAGEIGDGAPADSGDGPTDPDDPPAAVGADVESGHRPGTSRASEEGDGESLLYRFRHDHDGALMWIREMLASVGVVLLVGLLLFGVSGIWPPMVAVESGSMEPNMEVGDLVFVTEPGRLAPDAANNDVGVVTYEDGRAADYRTFGSYGSVVIYRPPGRTASPIIHRAMFRVEEGENWYDRADGEYHSAAGCAELRHCPAPHDGFITLGDNNGAYDQANGLAPPIRAEWVTGVARVRVPYLGYVRLIASGQAELSDVLATTVAAEPKSVDTESETEDPAIASDFRRPTVSDERSAVSDERPAVSDGGTGTSASAGPV